MVRKNSNKQQYFYIAILIIFLILPNLLLIFIGEDSAVGSLLKKSVFFLISFSIITIPLTFIKPKYYSYLVLVFFPFIIFETYHIFHFKNSSSQEIIASVLQTNFNEAKELILSSIYFILFTVLLLIILIFTSKKINNSFTTSRRVKKIIFFIFIFTFISLEIRNINLALQLNNKKSEVIKATNYYLKVQMSKNFPTGFFIKSYEVYNGFQKQKKYESNTSNFTFNALKNDTLKESEIYVLVIGETARKHNFHVYGYPKNTSPNLDSIKNLIAYKNVSSNSNVTSLSVPFMLTRATPKNPDIKFNESTILKAFKEANFHTYWISNQQIGTGSVFDLYSKKADVYINTSKPLDVAGYDENILPDLNKILTDTNKKKFIVIHTIGSHFRYNYRYPANFKVFTPTLKKGLSIENTVNYNNKKEIINSYDNSVLYTDFILGQIIEKLKLTNSNSFMYYISDHGENLYDNDDKKLLHGFENPTKFETEIPLFIWTSKKYNKNFNEKILNLNKNSKNKIETINTFYTLLDMSNISYPNFDKQKSFASKKFDSLQKRTLYSVNKTIIKID